MLVYTPAPSGASSNRRVVFEPGVTIEAKRGAFLGGADSLLTARLLENVTLEGHGALFRMQKQDYTNASRYNHSESRMGLQLLGCRNVSVVGLNVSSTGGP